MNKRWAMCAFRLSSLIRIITAPGEDRSKRCVCVWPLGCDGVVSHQHANCTLVWNGTDRKKPSGQATNQGCQWKQSGNTAVYISLLTGIPKQWRDGGDDGMKGRVGVVVVRLWKPSIRRSSVSCLQCDVCCVAVKDTSSDAWRAPHPLPYPPPFSLSLSFFSAPLTQADSLEWCTGYVCVSVCVCTRSNGIPVLCFQTRAERKKGENKRMGDKKRFQWWVVFFFSPLFFSDSHF